MNSRDILLETFQDNNANMITASDLREFVNATYDEMVLVENVIDNLQSSSSTSVLSANQGQIIDQRLNLIEPQVTLNTSNLQDLIVDVAAIQTKLDALTSRLDVVTNLLQRGLTGEVNINQTATLVQQNGITIGTL